MIAQCFQHFRFSCPHPVTFSGMLEMGRAFLPVDESWSEYLAQAQSTYDQINNKVLADLHRLVEETWPKVLVNYNNNRNKEKKRLQLNNAFSSGTKVKDESWRDDPWLRQLDWTCPPVKYTKPKYKKDGTYAKVGSQNRKLNTKQKPEKQRAPTHRSALLHLMILVLSPCPPLLSFFLFPFLPKKKPCRMASPNWSKVRSCLASRNGTASCMPPAAATWQSRLARR